MKTLQKKEQVLYRFRCDGCRNQFEMDEEETINDQELNLTCSIEFNCPVCGCVRHVKKEDLHKFTVMDDGTEIQEY